MSEKIDAKTLNILEKRIRTLSFGRELRLVEIEEVIQRMRHDEEEWRKQTEEWEKKMKERKE